MALQIVNIVAIVIIPIVAVLIGQWLQNRSEKRKDKMMVFTHLMSYRAFGYSSQISVNIINSIPIVFYKDKNVLDKYKNYMNSLNIRPEDYQQKQKEIDDNKTKMLEAMAKSLGYKNINWETIQNPYLPQGLINDLTNENLYKKGQVELAQIVSQITQNNNKEETKIKKPKSNT